MGYASGGTMKHISNLIDFSKVKQNKQSSPDYCEETSEVINILFKELRDNFTAFQQAWPTRQVYDGAKKVWLKAFMLAEINSSEQIQHGLNKCYLMKKPFVPTAGEFISWCKPDPKDFGFPDVYQAFQLAGKINQVGSIYIHPHVPTDTVIKHVISQIGANPLRGMPEKQAMQLFENYYAVACNQFIDGNIEPIKRALPSLDMERPYNQIKSDSARKKCMDTLSTFSGISNSDKMKIGKDERPEWPKEKICKNSKFFDKQIFDEYKSYLLSVDECLVLTLPIHYAHDRMKFLYEIEVQKHLRQAGYNPSARHETNESSQSSYKPTKIYKNWNGD